MLGHLQKVEDYLHDSLVDETTSETSNEETKRPVLNFDESSEDEMQFD